MIAKTLKHWQGHLAALTTALTLSLAVGGAQAVDLPAPGYDVDGFAIFYSSINGAGAAQTNRWIRTGSYYEFDNEYSSAAFLNAVEPVLNVTGIDLSNLPVPFLNQLDSVSLSGAGNTAWRMDLPGRREAVLSNLVLDIKTMTLWGDLQLNSLTGSQPGLIRSGSAMPILELSGGPSVGVEFRPDSEFGPTTAWWPENAPFAQPTPVGPLGTLPYEGLHHFASMGPDSALIWLPGLQFTPAVSGGIFRTSSTIVVGDMLIAVQVSAVPEAETQALAVIGLLMVGAAVRRRGRHRSG